jgi:lipid A ethanolaminephosphotransferase
MVMWFGTNTLAQLGIDRGCLQGKRGQPDLSHDNLFHSVLGLFEVQTSLYQPGLDIFRGCRPPMTAGK